MIKHLGKWAHNENPLAMSFPFLLSTLITLLLQLRGCFISFCAGLPVFANSFFLFPDFHLAKRPQRALDWNSLKAEAGALCRTNFGGSKSLGKEFKVWTTAAEFETSDCCWRPWGGWHYPCGETDEACTDSLTRFWTRNWNFDHGHLCHHWPPKRTLLKSNLVLIGNKCKFSTQTCFFFLSFYFFLKPNFMLIND